MNIDDTPSHDTDGARLSLFPINFVHTLRLVAIVNRTPRFTLMRLDFHGNFPTSNIYAIRFLFYFSFGIFDRFVSCAVLTCMQHVYLPFLARKRHTINRHHRNTKTFAPICQAIRFNSKCIQQTEVRRLY